MRAARVLAAFALVACGGKSVVTSGEDPANGNATSTGPSLDQLKAYCTSLCERFHACPGSVLGVDECTSQMCFPDVTLASRTVACARKAEDYLVCLNAVGNLDGVDDLCTTATPLMDFCSDERKIAYTCIDEYCNPSIDCRIR